MNDKKIKLVLSADDEDVAYLYLPDHPGEGQAGCVSKQVRLSDLIAGLDGPDVYLDFDKNQKLIGIEILA